MEYHLPIKPEKVQTVVWIKNYEIKNKTSFGNREQDAREGTMTLDLTFTSNDYSPHKYAKFLEDFVRFLEEREHSEN